MSAPPFVSVGVRTTSRQPGAGLARRETVAFGDDGCEAGHGWVTAGIAAVTEGVGGAQGQTRLRSDRLRRFLENTVSATGGRASGTPGRR